MFSRVFGALVIVCVLAIGGCSSKQEKKPEIKDGKLQGEIFIATLGGEGVKLALIQVSAFTEQEIEAHIAKVKKREPNVYQEVQLEHRQCLYEYEKANRDTKSARSYEATDRHLMENSSSGFFNNSYENSVRKRREAEAKEESAKEKLDEALYSIHLLESGKLYLDDLPSSNLTAKTDSDGKFEMSLPRGKRYALTARAERLTGLTRENYFWLVWVTLDGESKRIMLSNDNLLSSTSPDRVARPLPFGEFKP